MTRHTLSVLVEDKPGVLTRVASLFARRAFNINSLAVGPTEVPGISRMTVVVDADGELIEQVTKQLNKLINVIKIVELTSESSVQRDHILVKVRADAATRLQVTQAADLFRASVVDVSTDSVVIEATGHPDKLTALLSSAGALRRPRNRAVRHPGRRPRVPLHERPGPALRLRRSRSPQQHRNTTSISPDNTKESTQRRHPSD